MVPGSGDTPAPGMSAPAESLLDLLQGLPVDVVAEHVWRELPRSARASLRQTCKQAAQYASGELMQHLQIIVSPASLHQLQISTSKLHSRFQHPVALRLELRHAERPRGATPGGSANAGGGTTTARNASLVLSSFIDLLGSCDSVCNVVLQGWQELSDRDLQALVRAYPRLSRLVLVGRPNNNLLMGSALGQLAAGTRLRVLRVDTQLVVDAGSAITALGAAPSLDDLELTGLPLHASVGLPLACLSGLTRLSLSLEHRHAGSDLALACLSGLTCLRCLELSYASLGTGSSLWSAGWLLESVLVHLTNLTALHMPRAFLSDSSHPSFLTQIASLRALCDVSLGSIILTRETADAADQLAAADAGMAGCLARPWRQLALASAMPCYLEALLPCFGMFGLTRGSVAASARLAASPEVVLLPGMRADSVQAVGDAAATAVAAVAPGSTGAAEPTPRAATATASGTAAPLTPGTQHAGADQDITAWAPPSASKACQTPRTVARGVGGGPAPPSAGSLGARHGSLQVLELSSPCSLQLVQLLPHVAAWLGEVRLLLKLASNWQQVVGALQLLPNLARLALMPTFLYCSGTALHEQVVSAVAHGLPQLTHLELWRLNLEPQGLACLAAMPCLRFAVLGVADEARERRGPSHVQTVASAVAEAWLQQQQRRHLPTSQQSPALESTQGNPHGALPAAAPASHLYHIRAAACSSPCRHSQHAASSASTPPDPWVTCGAGGSTDRRCLLLACPNLTAEEVERMNGEWEDKGWAVRVQQGLEGTLLSRLEVAAGGLSSAAAWRR